MKKTNIGLLIFLIIISVSILVYLQSFPSEIQESDSNGVVKTVNTSLNSTSLRDENVSTDFTWESSANKE